MTHPLKLMLILSAFIYSAALAIDNNNIEDKSASNPLFFGFNETVLFSDLSVDYIKEATESSLNTATKSLDKLYAISKEDRTFNNTMLELDNIYNEASNVYGCVYLMGSVHPDDDVRNQALQSRSEFAKFFNEIQLDENLYRAVKDYSESDEAQGLTGYEAKFVKETVEDFERNGFALSEEKREELKVINNKISDLSLLFQKNISSVDDYLIVEDADMEGMEEDYKKSRKMDDGKYKIDLSYPSYIPFMKFSKSDASRKALYKKFRNRAAAENLEILNKVLILRKQMAELLGYKTYAEYRVEDRMAKSPATVWDFENDLVDKVKEKAVLDYEELLDVKRSTLNDDSIDVINTWESSFYNNILLKQKYDLDQNMLKEYFATDNVIDGLFQIAQHLFNVEFEEVSTPSTWQEDVRFFNVKRDGEIISYFYMDLYPRANKYSHAACFPMIAGKETDKGYQKPVATLVCNFPPPTEDRPSLLSKREVETFFHEFGHVLHNVLTQTKLSSHSGTSVARDFVEAPSQIFENWTWNYESLKLFATHYETGEVLPYALYERMLAAKNVGSGLSTLQQIYYGMIDFTLHDKYDPTSAEPTTEIVKNLQNEITLYPYVDGTHMHASFGHLMGYAAGYYGYLWSRVYAEDMFSVFELNGIMDQSTGVRYRDIILASGGSKDELEMVVEFLDRSPNQDAFLRSLGLEVIKSDEL
jgi:thimet oligopeptidase